ncbi:MAG: YgiQ family radical SAM protein, partial [Nannocystaceae bacterium]
NHYTSDRKIRSDDAYTPHGAAGKRPDRAVAAYAHRCREAFSGVPVIIGGIEASLRRVAHYDYWSDKVRKSVLIDSKADLLVFGNAERAICEIAERLQMGEPIRSITEVRGTAYLRRGLPEGWREQDSSTVDTPGPITPKTNPYAMEDGSEPTCASPPETSNLVTLRSHPRARTALRLPSFQAVAEDPVLYAHASRVLHRESNPHNARALIQRHGDRDAWINPPPIPLSTAEMDAIYDLPYQRRPHPRYADAKIPAYEMIKTSIMINRGCFGGCSFCSITEHEGRIIQSRSPDSIIREIERVRDTVPGFTGTISDLGGPTANMWRLSCKSPDIESKCRRPSCVFPGICENLNTDHMPLVKLYRRAR